MLPMQTPRIGKLGYEFTVPAVCYVCLTITKFQDDFLSINRPTRGQSNMTKAASNLSSAVIVYNKHDFSTLFLPLPFSGGGT